MSKKTQNRSKSAATLQQNCNKSATKLQQICYKSVPILKDLRGYLRKDVANLPQIWMPIETNLIFRYEFATLSPQTRYIFVAILLFCGSRGVDEIPADTTFLASALNVDARMLKKSLEELEISGLLVERKKDREEKEQTDRQKESASARVSVNDEILSENEAENEEKEAVQKNGDGNGSQFSLEECLRYVEEEVRKGATIQNANALAMKLYKTGQSDSFIKARLYPKEAERDQYGDPTQFTDQPCSVCFGAKMADIEGKGYGKCPHCRNEKGEATGFEPSEISDNFAESPRG